MPTHHDRQLNSLLPEPRFDRVAWLLAGFGLGAIALFTYAASTVLGPIVILIIGFPLAVNLAGAALLAWRDGHPSRNSPAGGEADRSSPAREVVTSPETSTDRELVSR